MAAERWRAWLAGLLALVGLADSLYLTVAHYSDAALACANNGVVNCDLVTRSSYGLVPGTAIPVSLAGVVWFGAALGLVVWLDRRRSVAGALALVAWSVAGVGVAVYLVYVELVRLHHICEWCTVAHFAAAAILLLAISAAQQSAQRAEA